MAARQIKGLVHHLALEDPDCWWLEKNDIEYICVCVCEDSDVLSFWVFYDGEFGSVEIEEILRGTQHMVLGLNLSMILI